MKKRLSKKLAALGLSAAAALSGGYLIIPWEGEVKNSQNQHVVYRDPIGIPTYCWGLTGKDMYGKDPVVGSTYTEEECIAMFVPRVRHFEIAVDKRVKVDYASTFQKAALVSFAFNVGEGAFGRSTLLKDLNTGDHKSACTRLLDWKYAGGRVLQGLENRRSEEMDWCMGRVDYDVLVTFSEIADWVKESYTLKHPQED